MRAALAEARAAGAQGEVPVGAVVVVEGEIVGRGGNAPIRTSDPTAHAEVEAIRQAGARLGNYRLVRATLYCTVEPCVMCMGVALHARIRRVVYGCDDPKFGGAASLYRLGDDPRLNHQIEVRGDVAADESRTLLRDFFSARRREPSSR